MTKMSLVFISAISFTVVTTGCTGLHEATSTHEAVQPDAAGHIPAGDDEPSVTAPNPSHWQKQQEPCRPGKLGPDGRTQQAEADIGVAHPIGGDGNEPEAVPFTHSGCEPTNGDDQ